MADEPIEALGGKTPMQYAKTPYMDKLVELGVTGQMKTVADGFHPGSEVANMAVLGYDLPSVYEGRGVLEAASIGVALQPGEMAMRCNLICVEGDILKNHSSGHISTEEADQLIEDMPKIEQLWVPDDRQREARYKEAMNTCDYRAWVSIVKTLYIRKQERTAQGKKITALDERYMRTAENELYSELSLTLGIPKDEMEQYIRERLTQ